MLYLVCVMLCLAALKEVRNETELQFPSLSCQLPPLYPKRSTLSGTDGGITNLVRPINPRGRVLILFVLGMGQANMCLAVSLFGAGLYGEAKRRQGDGPVKATPIPSKQLQTSQDTKNSDASTDDVENPMSESQESDRPLRQQVH